MSFSDTSKALVLGVGVLILVIGFWIEALTSLVLIVVVMIRVAECVVPMLRSSVALVPSPWSP